MVTAAARAKRPFTNVHEAKTHLSELLERVEKGEEIVIARAGRPIAKLVAYVPPPPMPRQLGTMRTKVWVSGDAFDATTDAQVAGLFLGEGPEVVEPQSK